MQLEKAISDARQELHKLLESNDTSYELILEVSQRLDLLIVEYMNSKG